MSDYAWAKVFCDLPRDPKLTVRKANDRWLFTVLILLARESKMPGVIDASRSNLSWLANYSGLSLKQVHAAIVYFTDEGMVSPVEGCLHIVNFAKRQAPKDPTAVDRQRRYDERKQAVTSRVSSRVSSPESNSVEDRGQRTEKVSANADMRIPEVFEAYRLSIQQGARLIDAARDKIRTRLKTFTLEELCDAVKKFSLDAWQMEHNAHKGAAWFFDSDKRIEGYLHMQPRAAEVVPTYTIPGQRRPDGKIQVSI